MVLIFHKLVWLFFFFHRWVRVMFIGVYLYNPLFSAMSYLIHIALIIACVTFIAIILAWLFCG